MNATPAIDKKAIRIHIVQELQKNHPNFNRLVRRQKRQIIRDACKAAEKALKSGLLKISELTNEERLGLGKRPEGIMTLDEMKRFVEDHQQSVLRFPRTPRWKYIKNPVLKFMDELLDDSLIDQLLATPGMTPAKRKWMPSRLLRMELLRTACFPEWSVRKFCDYLSDLAHKEERCFCNLPLHQNEMCMHSTLSTFRSSLTMEMRVNLMVYVAHHFFETGRINDRVIYMLDSTEVAEKINPQPLGKLEMGDGTFIRFYSDLMSDCGSRRNKRDKSSMVVGYRVHTLCVSDVERGMAYPLLSLAVAANHHDSQVLEPIIELARAIGLDLKVLSVDEAYANAEKQEEYLNKYGVMTVTPPKGKTEAPKHVDPESGAVYFSEICETPMGWAGYDQQIGGHIFVCNNDRDCPWSGACPKERTLPVDTGLLGPVPKSIPEFGRAVELRKVTERPFNLLKHMDGLEPCRMKTMATISAQMVFSQMIGIFKIMAGLRSAPKNKDIDKPKQEELPLAANG